jgi:hypothetical protein
MSLASRRRFIAALLVTIAASTADPTAAYEISKDGGVTRYWWHSGQYAQERRLPPNVGQHECREQLRGLGWHDNWVLSGGRATMLPLDLSPTCRADHEAVDEVVSIVTKCY